MSDQQGKLLPECNRVGGKMFSLIHQQLKLFSAFDYHINICNHDVFHLINLRLDPEKKQMRFRLNITSFDLT